MCLPPSLSDGSNALRNGRPRGQISVGSRENRLSMRPQRVTTSSAMKSTISAAQMCFIAASTSGAW